MYLHINASQCFNVINVIKFTVQLNPVTKSLFSVYMVKMPDYIISTDGNVQCKVHPFMQQKPHICFVKTVGAEGIYTIDRKWDVGRTTMHINRHQYPKTYNYRSVDVLIWPNNADLPVEGDAPSSSSSSSSSASWNASSIG